MPFVKTIYHIKEPMPAFLWLMRERGYTQSQAQRILDKQRLKQSARVITKAQMICGEVELSEFVPCAIPHAPHIEPLFSNQDFCVYDKPHDLLTHPKGRFHHYSLNDVLKSQFGLRAQSLHRLDKQTSGLVLCAINPASKKDLESLMASRGIAKGYCAIVSGRVRGQILIDKPIARQREGDLSVKSIITPQGKKSYTLIRPLAYHAPSDSTLIYALPLTGRTHQIRLHCAAIGHRILGDPLYGVSEERSRFYLEHSHVSPEVHERLFGAPYLCLNAYQLRFCFKGIDYHFRCHAPFAFMPHFQGFLERATFF